MHAAAWQPDRSYVCYAKRSLRSHRGASPRAGNAGNSAQVEGFAARLIEGTRGPAAGGARGPADANRGSLIRTFAFLSEMYVDGSRSTWNEIIALLSLMTTVNYSNKAAGRKES